MSTVPVVVPPGTIGAGAGGGGITQPAAQMQPASAPVVNRVRAYFAPVNRSTGTPVMFDAATAQSFEPDSPPAPWTDLGWIKNFRRISGSVVSQIGAGAPSAVSTQVRRSLDATLSFEFVSWGKLQMSLACASDQKNVLVENNGAAVAALRTAAGCTPTTLVLAAGSFAQGSIVCVDTDYTGQTGFLGTGVSCGYVQPGSSVSSDVDFVRRATLNVGLVTSVQGQTLSLATPLPGGTPAVGMGVQQVVGFQDREGGTFFQEWSGLFVAEGMQGDMLFLHYPRLQATKPAAEKHEALDGSLEMLLQSANLRALPIQDVSDGATTLCYRTYVPASRMAIG